MAYTRTPTLRNKEKEKLVGPLLNHLLLMIERERNQEPHLGLIIARHDFFEALPYMLPDRPTLAFCHAAEDQVCLPSSLWLR